MGSIRGGRIACVGSGCSQLDPPVSSAASLGSDKVWPIPGAHTQHKVDACGDLQRVRWERRQGGLMSDMTGFVPLSPQLSQGSDITASVDRTS